MTGVLPAGFPHSDIHGSLDICSSPWLFAAYHVFHRLSVPRHPPCALSCLTFLTTNVASFVGSVLIFWLENLILIYEFICIATDCYLWRNTFMFLITWLFFRTISSIDVYSHFDSMNQLWIIKKYLVSYLLYTVFKVQYSGLIKECFHSFLVSHINTKLFLCLYHRPSQPFLFFQIWRPPTFPYRLQYSIIGRLSLNHRVRDGYGCFP